MQSPAADVGHVASDYWIRMNFINNNVCIRRGLTARCHGNVCRYLVICRLKTERQLLPFGLLIITVIWAWPALLQVPWALYFDIKMEPQLGRRCMFANSSVEKPFFVGVVCVTCYLLPLLTIVIFYSLVISRVWKRQVR